MSRQQVDEALACQIPDEEARTELAQQISDFAVGCDISSVLSERLTAQYMYDHMGGLDGPDERDLERLQIVEAYNIIIPQDAAEFVVDRRSIFDPSEQKSDYRQDQDAQLINQAIQKWFKENIFMMNRVRGSDSTAVDNLVESKINIQYGIGEVLKYGIVHNCFEFPHSLHGSNEEKPMFLEMYGTLTNVQRQSGRNTGHPYFHLWEHEELHFQMRAITYSDQRYLTVHMPGYG